MSAREDEDQGEEDENEDEDEEAFEIDALDENDLLAEAVPCPEPELANAAGTPNAPALPPIVLEREALRTLLREAMAYAKVPESDIQVMMGEPRAPPTAAEEWVGLVGFLGSDVAKNLASRLDVPLPSSRYVSSRRHVRGSFIDFAVS